MGPPKTKGHFSVVRLSHAWFVACESREIRDRPIARVVQGVPLVLFRAEGGRPSALLDRCPHRNVPLSEGRVKEGQLECGYHGWRFAGGGACRRVPGLCAEPEGKARTAPSYATFEQDGFVWVWSEPAGSTGAEPNHAPYRPPHLEDTRYATVRRACRVPGSVHAGAENALDVPHTAFLHGGLFRTAKKVNEIDVVVRRFQDRVEAEYVGEPAPKGIAARVLAPKGGVVLHFDRFLLPSIAQVEYRLGEDSHLVTTSLLTPISDFETLLYAVVTFRLPLPHWLVRPFIQPVALHILKQDIRMLALQTDAVRRFGGEQYANTEIDVLGPQILRLLLQAQRGDVVPSASAEPGPPLDEHRVRMRT